MGDAGGRRSSDGASPSRDGASRSVVGEVDEGFGELDGFHVLLEVALHDGVAEGGVDAGVEEHGVGVTQVVDADAADHVVLDRAVGELDERAVADAAAEVGEELEHLVVGELAIGAGRADADELFLVVGQGCAQQLPGLGDAGIGEERWGDGIGHVYLNCTMRKECWGKAGDGETN